MKNALLFLVLISLCIACDKDEIKVDLPEVIIAYLDANYSDYELEEAELETLCTGEEVYEVEIELENDDEIELTFDMEGSLLFTEIEIEVDQLPADVLSRISTSYPNVEIEEAEQLNLFDDSIRYEVELENDIEVLIAADGAVICEEQDEDDD